MLKICWPLEVRPSIEMPRQIYIHWHESGAKYTICKADAAAVPLC